LLKYLLKDIYSADLIKKSFAFLSGLSAFIFMSKKQTQMTIPNNQQLPTNN